MSKDTFYFSHDYNVRADEKIKILIRRHGMIGYGVYWAIIEDLYNNANALRLDCEGIAYDLRVDISLVKSVINDFKLFEIDGDFFHSNSVSRRLIERNSKSENARKSALKRWSKKNDNANALPLHCEGNAIKERKGNKIKESIKEKNHLDEITPPEDLPFSEFLKQNENRGPLDRRPEIPTKHQVWEFFQRAGGTKEMAKAFYESNEGTGWYYRGSPIVRFESLANKFIASWKDIDDRKPKQQARTPTKGQTAQEILKQRGLA